MALNATIFKVQLQITDIDRGYYEEHQLTVARHPSETDERMMVRLLAFACHAHERLLFTRGLGDSEEPALWQKDLTGALELWIEVGQPDEKRLLKACGRSGEVVAYTYNSQAAAWWKGIEPKLERVRNLKVYSLPPAEVKLLAALVEPRMQFTFMRQEGEITWMTGDDSLGLHPMALRE